jgi:hypothetical protein
MSPHRQSAFSAQVEVLALARNVVASLGGITGNYVGEVVFENNKFIAFLEICRFIRVHKYTLHQ